MGFGVPVGDWLRGPLRDWAADLLTPDRLRRDGLLDATAVGRVWDGHARGESGMDQGLWGILMLQSWLEATRSSAPRHEGRPVEVGVA